MEYNIGEMCYFLPNTIMINVIKRYINRTGSYSTINKINDKNFCLIL